jgi:hypothetical protein
MQAAFNFSSRDVVVACASVTVVGLLVFYAVAAPTAKLTAAFGPIVPRPGTTAIVQGRVIDTSGGGLGGAQGIVNRQGETRRAVSDDAGTFRVDLHGGCGTYSIALRAHVHGDDVATTTRRRLCPGDALPVDARVVTEGHFLWVPGPR